MRSILQWVSRNVAENYVNKASFANMKPVGNQ